MPQHKNIPTLFSLSSDQVARIVKKHVTDLTGYLVHTWWKQKTETEKKPKFIFENRQKVTLASGRVKEMEEAIVGEGDMDFEFREDIDQYDLTHLEMDGAVGKRIDDAIKQYRLIELHF